MFFTRHSWLFLLAIENMKKNIFKTIISLLVLTATLSACNAEKDTSLELPQFSTDQNEGSGSDSCCANHPTKESARHSEEPLEVSMKTLQKMADQGTLFVCQNEGAVELAEMPPTEETLEESIAEEPKAPQISQIRHILKSVNLDFVPHREWFKGIPVGLWRMSKESFRITGNKLQDSWANTPLTCCRVRRAKTQKATENTPIDQDTQAEDQVESEID
jgi:hypothetical protein